MLFCLKKGGEYMVISDILLAEHKAMLLTIENTVKPFLDRIIITFPEYTDHGIDHSKRIIRLYDSVILDQDNIFYLKANEWTSFF